MTVGYNVVALNHTISGKLPIDLVRSLGTRRSDGQKSSLLQACPIPLKLPFPLPPRLHTIRRCTLHLSDPSQNHRLASLIPYYDILAVRPTTEKALQQACQSLSPDLISLDLSQRFPFHFKQKTILPAIARGIKFEIGYSAGTSSSTSGVDASIARRNLIGNATSLIRATRGRGVIISSEATRALACRGPADVVNLAACWGLGPERGVESITTEARGCIVQAAMRRTSFRGVVDVVYGGDSPTKDSLIPQAASMPTVVALNGKRKAETKEDGQHETKDQPRSKRQMKRMAKAARMAEGPPDP